MTTAAHEREYLSVAEVALELGVSAPTIRRRIEAGQLPAVQLGGRGSAVRISRADLDAWLTPVNRRREEAHHGPRRPSPSAH